MNARFDGMRLAAYLNAGGESARLFQGRRLCAGDYAGFEFFHDVSGFAEVIYTVRCGGSAVIVLVRYVELVDCDDPAAFVAARLVEGCERLWSTWMAL